MKSCQCCGCLDDGKDVDGIFICRECGRKAATQLNRVLTQQEVVELYRNGELRCLVTQHHNHIDGMRFDLMMRRQIMNTAAKGRRFEHTIRDLFRHSGYVVARCAASKPWDLSAANTRAVYAVECKSTKMSVQAATYEYEALVKKLKVPMRQEDGRVKLMPSLFAPILFFRDKLGNVAMLSNAYITDVNGTSWRPFFRDGKITEVLAIGPNARGNSEEVFETSGQRTREEED